MSRNGLLINYGWCSGCHSCELACRNARSIPLEQWGIKLTQVGPFKLSGEQTEWDYVPVPTSLCDLCADRVAEGRKPACVHNCLTQCIEYGPLDELMKSMAAKGKKVTVYLP
ncbi:4Fe-4S dicluster domain-containing protein [Desulfitobacterium hafniense]|uniref:4Fe-4S dicluster domain-containing protein n=1 Tax=Desulfitobacterium hafniense TaxID=49338 RepID=UPI000373E785|nr:4Fe-4S dicluster domain-containing protein [Desulfitobacterium hafniense]